MQPSVNSARNHQEGKMDFKIVNVMLKLSKQFHILLAQSLLWINRNSGLWLHIPSFLKRCLLPLKLIMCHFSYLAYFICLSTLHISFFIEHLCLGLIYNINKIIRTVFGKNSDAAYVHIKITVYGNVDILVPFHSIPINGAFNSFIAYVVIEQMIPCQMYHYTIQHSL